MVSLDDPDDPGASATTQRWLRRRPMRRGETAARSHVVGRMYGRYRVIDELGRGAMGQVYKAVDTNGGQVVALKVLFETNADGLRRINREFRRMADISHRNLVALYELGSAGAQRFLVMEYVPGLDFIRALRPGGVPCTPERLREAVRDLTLGVHALHERGRVHRDLKPSNVMVSEAGRVVILDFGLVNEIQRRTLQTSSMGMSGTPEYMAPEQAAGQLATTASDWYAVGVMLFQVVTGVLPFSGAGIQQMFDKQILDPPLPSFHVPTLQPELDALIRGLLAREPANRPSAQDLIAWCAGRTQTLSRRSPTPAPLPRAVLVGLEEQLRTLEEGYHRVVHQRQPVMVDVFGPSGTGKTALVQTFLADVRRREGTVVLEGRCFAQESVDYKAFDSLIDSLAIYLRRLPPTELASLLDDSFTALTQIFPVLEQVKETTDEAAAGGMDAALGVDAVQAEIRRRLNLSSGISTDALSSRARGLRGLKLLFYRMALRARLVLVIDDLQWGDADSAHLLADLLALPSPPPLLFVGLWRSEDAGRSPLLQALAIQRCLAPPPGGVVTVETGPLDADDAARLALQRLGRTDTDAQGVARMIARESAGNPMLIEALVQHVEPQADLGQFVSQGGRAPSLERLIQRRLRSLSPEAQRLLELIAVAGQPVSQDVLTQAAGLPADLRPALGQLRAERLIRTSARDASSVEAYHDRIRVAVAHAIARHELAERHHSLAEGLLATQSDDLERLAQHLFAAGERERAAEYAADAAYAAERTLAFERAAALYRLASVCRPQDWVLKRKSGDALMLAGRTREAGPLYLAAAEQAPAAASARIRRAAAESLFIAGHLEEGRTTLRPLLAAIGAPYPEQGHENGLLRTQLEGLVARGTEFVEHSEPQLASRDLVAIDTCWSAGKGLMIADPVRGGYYVLRAASLALDAGEPRRIIRSLALAATVAATRAPSVSQAWLQTAEQIATKIKDPEALGFVAVNAGVIHRTRGAWHDAFEALDDGLHQLLERGQTVTWERSFAVTSLFTSLEALGEIRRLAAETTRLARLAQEAGDRHMGVMASIYGALVQLARDEPGVASQRLRLLDGWRGEAFEVHVLHTLKIQVDHDLYVGDAAGSWRRVLEVWPTLEQTSFSWLPVRRIEAYELRTRAALAILAQDPAANQNLRAVIPEDIKQIRQEPMIHAKALAALLEASYCAVIGDREGVLRRLTSAIYGFDVANMSLLATVARRSKGQWMRESEGRELVRQAETFMRMQDIVAPQRWAAMVAPGLQRRDHHSG